MARQKQLINTVAAATVALANSVAWAEIVARLQAAGCSPKRAYGLRERVRLARRVRKAGAPESIDAPAL